MLEAVRRGARVVPALVRVSLTTSMQYRSDFIIDAFAGMINAAAAVAPILLVYGHRQQVLGWDVYEATVVMGLFLLMRALVGGLVEPNLGEVVEAIRSGTLDLVLLKPADAQLLVSARRVAPNHIWTAFAALALLAWASAHLPVPGVLDVLVAGVLLLAGVVAMYGLWVLVTCTSFFFVRVDNLRFLLWSVTDAGRWPLTVFAWWVQLLLLLVVPVGLLTTFPALALRGEWSVGLVLSGLGIALGFSLGSRWAWRRSLASYTSASS